MSSRTSSRSRTPTKAPSKSTSGQGFGTDEFRYEVLEPNNIFLEDVIMGQERWSNLAFSLGIPARHGQRHNSDTQKLAQRMQKRKVFSASQTFDLVRPFIESIVSDSPKISQQNRCLYHSDAVPTHESLKNTIHRLPTPKPSISVGYYRDVFSIHQDELQNGIIIGPDGEPIDLNHISQPVLDHFWPFFVVEISDQSLAAAKHISSITAGTCNNALSLLANAVSGEDSFLFDAKFAKTFSLSIHGKIAVLSTHGAQGLAPHVTTTISTYKLDDEIDVASLADRVHSIVVWAQYNRLGEIVATLDALDKKVHGKLSTAGLSDSAYEFDPSCLRGLKLQPPRRPDRIKVALKAGLPWWLSRS